MPWDEESTNNTFWIKAKPWILIILAAILAMGIGYFGFNFWSNRGTQTKASDAVATNSTINTTTTSLAEPSPTPTPSASPSVSPTPTGLSSTAPIQVSTTQITPTPTGPTPQVTNAETLDTDSDGKIDQIKLTFSIKMNTSADSANGFKVIGYTIKSGAWNTNDQLLININEGNSYDTDVIPRVTYDASQGTIKSSAGAFMSSTEIKTKDMVTPVAVSAVASDNNSQAGIQAGDKVTITFSEPIKISPSIVASNINKILPLNHGHSWLDGTSSINAVNLSSSGKILTITLSTTGGLPTITSGDIINVIDGISSIKDLSPATNSAEGAPQITGSF